MLLELKVSQFAIINHLEVSFDSGLNILSGETGAGKSVVLKSLALLMGEKAESDAVRSGCQQAVIEGLFDLSSRPDVVHRLEDQGIPVEENSLIVRRVITAQGKSKVYLNSQLSALNALREVVSPLIAVTGINEPEHSAPLIEMTGQHDNRNLQTRHYHLDVLDQFANAGSKRQAFTVLFDRHHKLQQEIEKLEDEARTRHQRLDFLVYQRDEIAAAELSPGEEERLESQVSRLRHSHKLLDYAAEAHHLLYSDENAVTVQLHHLISRALELRATDASLEARVQPLVQAKSLVEDFVYDMRDYEKHLNADPEELNQLEERLTRIRRLQKKFGGDSHQILKQLMELEGEIQRLQSAESSLESMHKEKAQIALEMRSLAGALHALRVTAAKKLESMVNDELADLNMKGVRFGIQLELLNEVTATGMTAAEFTIQASKKDQPRPLAKYASGGELSRILLALKCSLGQSEQPRTYLFDEVDTGVSGETAEKVGRKLKEIAANQQVICVTHLPQVAACADHHYFIEKSAGKSGVEMSVKSLAKADRVREIARLISGEKITSTSLEHAKQLLRG